MQSRNTPASQIIETLIQYRNWWLVPTLACTVFAVGYALFTAKKYTSRQTLVIRDDLVGTFFKPGRFDSFDSMKSAQETILEVARRPHVVKAALKKLGPAPLTSESAWLSEQNIEKTQGLIQISAPNGAEFGRTEAIILSVKQSSRDRAKEFVEYLLHEIEQSLKDLRSQQFHSMQLELKQAADIAAKSYESAADKLKDFEKPFGEDLITLISLNDSQAGTNILQSEIANLNIEQRKAWADVLEVEKQIEILSEVSKSPEYLQEVPQELLALQPTLADLAKGLNEAVLAYAKAKGRWKVTHPNTRASAREVADIKSRIKEKMVRTLDSLNNQLDTRERVYQRISKQVNDKKTRLSELSSVRVDYETLKAEVGKKREINGNAQASLAEIESLGSAAEKVNLISKVDEPQTELYADGPSNKLVVLGGMFAGLFIGFGMVMFVVPLDGQGSESLPINNEPSPTQQRATQSGDTTSAQSVNLSDTVKQSESISQSEATSRTMPVEDDQSSFPVRRSISDQISKAKQSVTGQSATAKEPNAKAEPKADLKPLVESTDNSATEKLPTGKLESDNSFSSAVTSEKRIVNDGLASNREPVFAKSHSESEESKLTIDNAFATDDGLPDEPLEVDAEEIGKLQSTLFSKALGSLQEKPITNETPEEPSEELALEHPEMSDFEVAASVKVPEIKDVSELVDSTKEEILVDDSTVDSGELSLESLSELKATFEKNGAFTDGPQQSFETNESSELNDEELDALVAAQELDLAEEEIELTEDDLAKLRIGTNSSENLVEKVNQLGQSEILITDEFDAPIESITQIGDFNESIEDSSQSELKSTGLPLQTSIANSSDFQTGQESEPKFGNQPENRPAATTVDLRMLKEQLAGGGKFIPDPKIEPEQPDFQSEDESNLDSSLTDLANSIRDMCKKQSDPEQD